LLKIDFPRLPLPKSIGLFNNLSKLGKDLVSLHLLFFTNKDFDKSSSVSSSRFEVEKISWSKDTVWIDKSQTVGFEGVNVKVWDFHIGGYQVCEKWLKDRKGRVLSDADIHHYKKILVAISETIKVMNEIDLVISNNGGWPNAFED
jgi:predicted helicase